MPRITFITPAGERQEIEAPSGLSVMEIARMHDLGVEGACEGSIACATCHVIVDAAFADRLEEASAEEEGMLDLAEEIFESPVRLGTPCHVGGLQDVVRGPMYATGVGLVLFGASQDREGARFRIRDESIFGRVKQRMRDWFYQFE